MPAGQRSLDRLLWAGQWMLALSFHLIGMIKLGLMVHDVQPHFGLRVEATTGMLHTLGLVETILSLAVIFPALLHVVPKLSTGAAASLGAEPSRAPPALTSMMRAIRPEAFCTRTSTIRSLPTRGWRRRLSAAASASIVRESRSPNCSHTPRTLPSTREWMVARRTTCCPISRSCNSSSTDSPARRACDDSGKKSRAAPSLGWTWRRSWAVVSNT